jgi:hypothetical protein
VISGFINFGRTPKLAVGVIQGGALVEEDVLIFERKNTLDQFLESLAVG